MIIIQGAVKLVTKEEIKEAAFKLFALKGYEATSTKDIGKSVGLSKQSLYSHFKSKSDIYLEVLCDQSKSINEAFNDAFLRLSGRQPEEVLKGIFECLIEIFSYKERLLLWKRTYITYVSGEKEIIKNVDWQFDRKIHEYLYNSLCQYEHVNTPQKFRSSFISYMLVVQGYLDWMIVMPHKKETFEDIWLNYWTGSKHYFEA